MEPDPQRRAAWTLYCAGTPQSHVDVDDPTHLEFAYVRTLGHVLDAIAPPRRPLRALHLGGGAFTLARYVAATRPRSDQQVVEIDGDLVELVRRVAPPERGARIRVRTADARAALTRAPRAVFDVVVLDVFAAGVTPAHLTTVEFLTEVAAALTPAGVYAANLADGGDLRFARGAVATAQESFAHVVLVADPTVLRGRRFGNLVLVASAEPLPADVLSAAAAGDRYAGRLLRGGDVTRFRSGAAPRRDATAVASPVPPPGTF